MNEDELNEPTDEQIARAAHLRTRSKTHMAAFEKSAGWCFYCGNALAEHLEHQVPLSRGGKTTVENCVVSCGNCNNRKAGRTSEEFRIHLMLRDGRPPVRFAGEQRHQRRDWLIVASSKIHERVEPYADRLAAFLGG